MRSRCQRAGAPGECAITLRAVLLRVGHCLHAQSCPRLCDPNDCSPPGSSVRGTLQARILEWVAMPSSRGSSQRGIKPMSCALQANSLLSEPPGKFIHSRHLLIINRGFPGGSSDKEPNCQCRRHKRCGFNSWVGKIHWRRAW